MKTVPVMTHKRADFMRKRKFSRRDDYIHNMMMVTVVGREREENKEWIYVDVMVKNVHIEGQKI